MRVARTAKIPASHPSQEIITDINWKDDMSTPVAQYLIRESSERPDNGKVNSKEKETEDGVAWPDSDGQGGI